MIKIEKSYYYCDDEPAADSKKPEEQAPLRKEAPSSSLQTVGDVKGYLELVSKEIQKIKTLKMQQKEESLKNQILLEKLNPKSEEAANQSESVRLHIAVPAQLYELDRRINSIEEKVKVNELVRQKIQRKGKFAERAKMLSNQIQKLMEKSPEIIANHIQNYCQGLDEKEENIKALFLYESFVSTQGMYEEMEMLASYLQNLNQIQTKLQGMASKKSMVENHSKLLERRAKVSEKIAKLHKFMTEEYEKLSKQIDSV